MNIYQGQICKYLSTYENLSNLLLAISTICYSGELRVSSVNQQEVKFCCSTYTS